MLAQHSNEAEEEFDRLLRTRAVQPLFQPIVSLVDGKPVGFEALARGPRGSRFASPQAMFAEAGRRGVVAELDWVCGTAACTAALDAGMVDVPLFVNVEPQTLTAPCPADLFEAHLQAVARLNLVVEITERVIRDPAALLRSVIAARRAHTRIALDDIGADPAALGMISLLAPDVIKLDRGLVQAPPASWAQAYVVNAVLTEASRTGAAVLAEGIETDQHVQAAVAMGATLGQGWYFGRPAPLPTTVDLSAQALPRVMPRGSIAATPFEAAGRHARTVRVSGQMLAPMSQMLEQMALHVQDAHMLFAVFPAAAQFDDATRISYMHVSHRGVIVTVYTPEPPIEPVAGLHTVSVSADDPLAREYALIVIGSYFAGALIARLSEPSLPAGTDDPYDAVLSYDRTLVIEAIHTLIDRIPPLSQGLGAAPE